MGTCSLICVFYKGRFVIAQYAQWDGYPEGEGQGLKVLNFLLDPANILGLKSGLEHIFIPDQEKLRQLSRENALFYEVQRRQRSWQTMADIAKDSPWPSLSPDTGAGILEIVARATAEEPVPIELSLDFANDNYCEWAYVVDLDCRIFEVFSGLERKDKPPRNRFGDIGEESDRVPALLKSFSFTELPTTEDEFIPIIIEAEDQVRQKWREAAREQWRGKWRKPTQILARRKQWNADASKRTEASGIGLLNFLPPEVRAIIYEYVFSDDPLAYRKGKSGVELLCSSTMVYEEAIPLLYRSRLFGILSGPDDDAFKYRYLEWDDKALASGERHLHVGKPIRYLSADFFNFVRNLRVCFTDRDSTDDFKLRKDNLQKSIFLLCNNLRDSTHLCDLDISIHFICSPEVIDDMACLIEPMKMLRCIRNPNVVVYGHQQDQTEEARWNLTEEYTKYLEELLMSPHGMPDCSADGIQVFEDFFESSESGDESINSSELNDLSLDIDFEESLIEQYLRDVHNTTDRTALYSGQAIEIESVQE